MRVALPSLWTVTEGDDVGKTWLVDPLLTLSTLRKYSGPEEAGDHQDVDFAGATCDAFAHFALERTNGNLIPCDIQGAFLFPCR
jgi:hypothetical protein